MNDDELKEVLQTWKAPPAPESLRSRVIRPEKAWYSWLLSGEIRLPVPVALAILGLFLFLGYRMVRPPVPSLSDFEQVQQLQPRIVRTVYENR